MSKFEIWIIALVGVLTLTAAVSFFSDMQRESDFAQCISQVRPQLMSEAQALCAESGDKRSGRLKCASDESRADWVQFKAAAVCSGSADARLAN